MCAAHSNTSAVLVQQYSSFLRVLEIFFKNLPRFLQRKLSFSTRNYIQKEACIATYVNTHMLPVYFVFLP